LVVRFGFEDGEGAEDLGFELGNDFVELIDVDFPQHRPIQFYYYEGVEG
jgi:hypothetical protein